jgi:hypothetical protein
MSLLVPDDAAFSEDGMMKPTNDSRIREVTDHRLERTLRG